MPLPVELVAVDPTVVIGVVRAAGGGFVDDDRPLKLTCPYFVLSDLPVEIWIKLRVEFYADGQDAVFKTPME